MDALLSALLAVALSAAPREPPTHPVFVTAYNPAQNQTDGSPCTGASGRDLCRAAREGDRVIALSRNLLWFSGGPFKWHDKVKLHSEIPQCDGIILSVEDTMNARFTDMADLFFLDRSDNTSCKATIEKVTFPSS